MSLTVVTGPMFAGKSSWIVQYVRRHAAAGIHGIVIKPLIAARYSNETNTNIVTHDQVQTVSLSWPMQESLNGLWKTDQLKNASFILLDEAQFFTGLYAFAKACLSQNKQLILVGLNGDYLQRPFLDSLSKRPEFLECMALADSIELLHSLCEECCDGTFGHFTKRISSDVDQVIQVGAKDTQKSVCRRHLGNELTK